MPSLLSTHGMAIDDLSGEANIPGRVQQGLNQVDEFYGKKYANVAALPGSGKFDGQRVWVDDIDAEAVWTGSAWRVTPTTVANFAALPTTGRYDGLRIWLVSEKTYATWDAAAAAWKLWTGIKRQYMVSHTVAAYANSAAIGNQVIPSIPVASRVLIEIAGQVGVTNAAGQIAGLALTASAGTLTNPTANNGVLMPTAASSYPFATKAWVDLSASTASTVSWTMNSTTATSASWRGMVTLTVLLPGEY